MYSSTTVYLLDELIVLEDFSALHDSDDASLDLVFPVLVHLLLRLVALRLGLAESGARLLNLDPVKLRREGVVDLKSEQKR